MNKYKYEIDKILYLLYSNRINECIKVDPKELNRFINRIGDGYEINENDMINTRLACLHMNEVCKKNPKCRECNLNIFCIHYRNKAKKTKRKDRYNIIDLFCGAGGFALGFNQLGFKTVLANDIDPGCIETYRLNHPEISEKNIIKGDISEIIESIPELLRDTEVDVIIGGPPCQGFSSANRQRMIDDPRNQLYKYFVQAISLIRPAFFVMENVRGMLSIEDEIREDFHAIDQNYDVSAVIINAQDFGIPQNRNRVIFLGNRVGLESRQLLDEIVRSGRRKPKYVLRDALSGLKTLEANTTINTTEIDSEISGEKISSNEMKINNNYLKVINGGMVPRLVFNHKARYNNNRDIEIFTRLNQGDKSDDPKISDIMPYANRNHIFKDKYFRLYEDKPCKTITAHMKLDCNMYIHPYENRGLTPREAARVQSYPDSYYFAGPYTKTYMQVGNSVPPIVAKEIARVIKKYLNNLQE